MGLLANSFYLRGDYMDDDDKTYSGLLEEE